MKGDDTTFAVMNMDCMHPKHKLSGDVEPKRRGLHPEAKKAVDEGLLGGIHAAQSAIRLREEGSKDPRGISSWMLRAPPNLLPGKPGVTVTKGCDANLDGVQSP
ncbi:hypothetical protein FOL47_002813 [Perkinsus chesapeaki]|uniref:Uncharacterized protein n=1 Tax=Perkinsus chesapeaki TaxID=330153 RepID=A0A7J6MBY2_PERCH|nr:hypothetical protein FOL47_002813 [Perkinsus chesapeaki]